MKTPEKKISFGPNNVSGVFIAFISILGAMSAKNDLALAFWGIMLGTGLYLIICGSD